MDVPDEVILTTPDRSRSALRAGVGIFALVVGWFILSAVFGGTAAHAAPDLEPETADSSLLGSLAEPLDEVTREAPIVPEVLDETAVHQVSETAGMVVTEVVEITPPAIAPTIVTDVVLVELPSTTAAAAPAVIDTGTSASVFPPAEGSDTMPATSPTPVAPDQPLPASSTSSTAISHGTSHSGTAAHLSGMGWSPASIGVELRSWCSEHCPDSATHDSDSTPD